MVRKKAYVLDASYTVRDGKTYVSLLLKGKKTVRLYYQHDPYFLVEGPLDKIDQFMDIEAARKSGEMTSPLRVEEVERTVDKKKAQKLAKKIHKGKGFNLEDFREQLVQMKKMGGVAGVFGPGTDTREIVTFIKGLFE